MLSLDELNLDILIRGIPYHHHAIISIITTVTIPTNVVPYKVEK